MTDDIDQIISEIAVKNGVTVGRDDPIMALHTMHCYLIKKTAQAQEACLDTFRSDVEGIAQRWGDNATSKAEKVLSAGLKASNNSMNLAIEQMAGELRAAIQTETSNLTKQIDSRLKQTKQIATLNILAGLCIVAASVILVFSR